MVKSADGGYAIAGIITNPDSSRGRTDFLLLKAAADGKLAWYKMFGGAADDQATSIVRSSDGGYALTGYTSSFGPYNNNFWLVRTDSSGNLQWAKAYGRDGLTHKVGAGYNLGLDYGYGDNRAKAVIQTSDGGFAMTGYTGLNGISVWLVKTDSNGVEQWNQTYNGGQQGSSLVQTGDGGFAIAATKYARNGNGPGEIWIIKTNSIGIAEWTQEYPHYDSDNIKNYPIIENFDPCTIIQTKDNALAVLGTAEGAAAKTSYFKVIKTVSFLPSPTQEPQPIKPQTVGTHLSFPQITIRSDGTSTPSNAPIIHNGNLYTFTANFSGSVLIQKDNIIVDGAGYTLLGNGSIIESDGSTTFIQLTDTGIILADREGVQIKNMQFIDFIYDIQLKDSCKRNSIENCTFMGNFGCAIYAPGIDSPNTCENNRIYGNTFDGFDYSLILYNAKECSFVDNTVRQNAGISLIISGISNLFYQNVFLGGGIGFSQGFGNKVIGNTINGTTGLDAPEKNVIVGNAFASKTYGIVDASNCTIFGNSFTKNGVAIEGSSTLNNTIYANNFVNNRLEAGYWEYRGGLVALPTNSWDKEKQGNYWSNYNGTDADQDGIGDTPYVIDSNNQDLYPLMNPINIESYANFTVTSIDTPPTQNSNQKMVLLAAIIVVLILAIAILVLISRRNRIIAKNITPYATRTTSF